MAVRQAIYLIVKDTGLISNDGVEQVILLEAKLSRAVADLTCEKYENARVVKMIADKFE